MLSAREGFMRDRRKIPADFEIEAQVIEEPWGLALCSGNFRAHVTDDTALLWSRLEGLRRAEWFWLCRQDEMRAMG